jgi:hypothetical protein
MGTEIHHRYIRYPYPLVQQLMYICLPQIKIIFSDMERMRKKHIIPESPLLEYMFNILSDFVTIVPYARTESDHKGRGNALEMFFHFSDNLLNQSLAGALPTAMDGCNGSRLFIHNQDR